MPPGAFGRCPLALTLRLLGGLTTEEIARAFLVRVVTIQQRIVRAKRTLTEARVPFEVPAGTERWPRAHASVLRSSTSRLQRRLNSHGRRRLDQACALCEDALRLGRVLAELMPREPEVHGLVALMEIQASRLRTRVGPSGEPVLLLDQDRTVGSPAHPPWFVGARASRTVGHHVGAIRVAGGDWPLVTLSGAHAGRNGLGAHRCPVRRAGSSCRYRRLWS